MNMGVYSACGNNHAFTGYGFRAGGNYNVNVGLGARVRQGWSRGLKPTRKVDARAHGPQQHSHGCHV